MLECKLYTAIVSELSTLYKIICGCVGSILVKNSIDSFVPELLLVLRYSYGSFKWYCKFVV